MRRLQCVFAIATIATACARFSEDTSPVDGGGASSSSSSTSSSSSSASSSGMGTPGAEIIAAGLDGPTKLRATKKSVYWIATTTAPQGGTLPALQFCPVEGCGGNPPTNVAFDVSDFTINDGFVYWTSGARLSKCPVNEACGGVLLVEGVGGERAGYVAAANDLVHVGLTDTISGRVVRCAAQGCGVPTQTEGMVRSGPMVASPAQGLYFFAGATITNELHHFADTTFRKLGAMPGLPTSLAVAGTYVYFVSQRTLFFCQPTTTCAPIPVAGALSDGVYSVSASNDDLFWSLTGEGGVPGKIVRCADRPCRTPKVVFEGGDPAAVDDNDGFIYWSDLGGGVPTKGAIKRLRL